MEKSDVKKPYYFVPLEEECDRKSEDKKDGEGEFFTGYFDCEIELLSPLFIPSPEGDAQQTGSDVLEFFSYEPLKRPRKQAGWSTWPTSNPVIPASEIRGMVRSVFEVMSNSCLSTSRYRQDELKKVNTILEKRGGYQPCSDRKHLCMACSVFGMVAKEKADTKQKEQNIAAGSRVWFTDARLKEGWKGNINEYYMDPWVLGPTASPHPEKTKYYTVRPKGIPVKDPEKGRLTWDYTEYWYQKEDISSDRFPLAEDEPMLRGRKFYRHSDTWNNMKSNTEIKQEMDVRIRPLKPDEDIRFVFRVYFDRITKEEQKLLRRSLDFEDKGCAHKLGRGKPYGLGSVLIKISDIKIRTLDESTGKMSLQDMRIQDLDSNISPENDRKSVKILKKEATWKEHLKKVSYSGN